MELNHFSSQSNVAHDPHKHRFGIHPSFSPIQHGGKIFNLDTWLQLSCKISMMLDSK
jgi:hypothetical protein